MTKRVSPPFQKASCFIASSPTLPTCASVEGCTRRGWRTWASTCTSWQGRYRTRGRPRQVPPYRGPRRSRCESWPPSTAREADTEARRPTSGCRSPRSPCPWRGCPSCPPSAPRCRTTTTTCSSPRRTWWDETIPLLALWQRPLNYGTQSSIEMTINLTRYQINHIYSHLLFLT